MDWSKVKLLEIVEQLEKCKFECEAGRLEMNEAFIELKKRSQEENIMSKWLFAVVTGHHDSILEFDSYEKALEVYQRSIEITGYRTFYLAEVKEMDLDKTKD